MPIPNNQLVSFQELQNMIDTEGFSQNKPFIPSNKLADKVEVEEALIVQPIGIPDNQLVQRDLIIATAADVPDIPTDIVLEELSNRTTEWIGIDYYCEEDVPPPDNPPTSPTIILDYNTHQQISVTWSGATDDNAVVGYRIYLDSVLITTVNETVLTWVFNSLEASTTYRIHVTALDGVPQSSPLDSFLDVTTDVAPINTVTAPTFAKTLAVGEGIRRIEVSGATATAGIKGYNVYYYDNTFLGFMPIDIGWIKTREGGISRFFIETVDNNDDVSPTRYVADWDVLNGGINYVLFYPIDSLPQGEPPGATRCLGAPDFVFHAEFGDSWAWYKGSTLLGTTKSITIPMPSRTTTYYGYVTTNGVVVKYTRIITVENCNLAPAL